MDNYDTLYNMMNTTMILTIAISMLVVCSIFPIYLILQRKRETVLSLAGTFDLHKLINFSLLIE